MRTISAILKNFLLVAAVSMLGLSFAVEAGGIVSSIDKAPIVPDGDVAGRQTDVVITLDSSLDPSVDGRTLLNGKTIRVTLPGDFLNVAGSIGLPATCPAPDPCNTGVLLQGWPQNPIPPSPANYTLTLDGPNTIVYTAARDLAPGDPTLNGPGIKQMHLILKGFINPNPGVYSVLVEAETGPGGTVETGTAHLHIIPKSRPSINVTSVFNPPPPFPNTIFQKTGASQTIPLPWDFLIWNRRDEPAVGVGIRQKNRNHAQLVNGKKVVGQIFIEAPKGARGQEIGSQGLSTLINGPVLGIPTGRLRVDFTTGDAPGDYTITFQMNNGNSVQMHVEAN